MRATTKIRPQTGGYDDASRRPTETSELDDIDESFKKEHKVNKGDLDDDVRKIDRTGTCARSAIQKFERARRRAPTRPPPKDGDDDDEASLQLEEKEYPSAYATA